MQVLGQAVHLKQSVLLNFCHFAVGREILARYQRIQNVELGLYDGH